MYNKLFSKIVTSSIWLEPTPTRMIWITFLAVMDEDGFAPFASIANLAHTARIELQEATEAVRILESADENSGDKDHEGRRIERVPGGWMILNAAKYRDIVTRVVAREKTRERVRRFRERKDGNADVTPRYAELRSVTPSETDSDADSDAKTPREETRAPTDDATEHAEWEKVKAVYPSGASRQDWIGAERAARLLVENGLADWAKLHAGVTLYAANKKATGDRVMDPVKFFTAADKPWSQAWPIPPPKKSFAQMQQDGVTERFLRGST